MLVVICACIFYKMMLNGDLYSILRKRNIYIQIVRIYIV